MFIEFKKVSGIIWYNGIMNIFENAPTWTKQGDIGEARAILELMKKGYLVSKPFSNSSKYDLIADDGNNLLKVQVKTTNNKSNAGSWIVQLRTTGVNSSGFKIRNREDGDYDLLFVCTAVDECWLIPEYAIESHNAIYLGDKYEKFRI